MENVGALPFLYFTYPAEWPAPGPRPNRRLRPGLGGLERRASSKHGFTLGDACPMLQQQYGSKGGVSQFVERWLLFWMGMPGDDAWSYGGSEGDEAGGDDMLRVRREALS